jgi:hypothetical protein
MKRSRVLNLLLVVFIASSCSRTKDQRREARTSPPPEPSAAAAVAPKDFKIVAQGEPYNLHFASGVLDFCDNRGGLELDLRTGQQTNKDRNCAIKDEPNAACSGLSFDVEVRSPPSEPNDIIDLDGSSSPLKGRVHDCAADGKMLAIVTASAAVLIDTTKSTTTPISSSGGDRVAIGYGWVAWAAGSDLQAAVLK